MLDLRRSVLLLLSLFLVQILTFKANAQPTTGEGPRHPGTTGVYSPYDTTVHRELQRIATSTAGTIEQPIDPDSYHLGPNDVLSLTIWTGFTNQYDLVVTPEAKLIIQRVGEVDVRGKTLTEAKRLVREAVGRVYRTDNISLSLSAMRSFKINVIGGVKYPGPVVATPATRVAEVINLAGGANEVASKRDVTIIRNNHKIAVDLLPYYSEGLLSSNPTVEGGDVVIVGIQDPKKIVSIYGAVAREGEYMFSEGDSISSMINYSLGFTADAFLDSIEVVSTDAQGNISREFIRALPDGTLLGDRALRAGDRVFVRALPKFRETSRVAVAGGLTHPGSYAIDPGRTRLREVIERAGGFTDDASIADATLTRRTSIERDRRLDQILQIDPEKRTPEEIEYFRTKSLERPGVMTIDFTKLMAGADKDNILLVAEDSLYVPTRKNFLTLSGKVKNPGNLIYQPGTSFRQYIDLAGGYGWRADEGGALIIKGKTGDTFLASSTDYVLEPGDTIYVPEEQKSDFWEGFTKALTIFAQLSTIVAVILSIRASTK